MPPQDVSTPQGKLDDLPVRRGRAGRREDLASLQPAQPPESTQSSFSAVASRRLVAARRRRSQSPGQVTAAAKQSEQAVRTRAERASSSASRPRRYSYTSDHASIPPPDLARQHLGENEARVAELVANATLSATDEPARGFRKPLPKESDEKTVEELRMGEEAAKERYWRRWGPYVSERQWGTVREDYSADGNAWDYFPHDHARSRAYRWGEDGLAGVSDNHNRLAITLALWNGHDRILKERVFGVSNHEGNHGEDVKELYYYLDNVPSHSYMKYLYKYPQQAFPYEQLLEENGRRSREVPEFEITDTSAFDDNRYWDILVEYAKDADEENAVSMRITAFNRGPEPADLHVLPQATFANTWAWPEHEPENKPSLHQAAEGAVQLDHPTLGRYFWYAHASPAPCMPWKQEELQPELVSDQEVQPALLFAENDTNYARLYGGNNAHTYSKDAFHDHLIPSHRPANAAPDTQYVNPDHTGTKVAAHYFFPQVPANGGCVVVRIKLTPRTLATDKSIDDDDAFDAALDARRSEADEFYHRISAGYVQGDRAGVLRQLLAGMLWTKQFYYFVQREWVKGDPGQPPPPPHRAGDRNASWTNLYMRDILSVPDKFEYPYPAIWDLAFHTIPLALVDPAFAKGQLDVFTREWYMKPDGAMPAYEWNYDDVNPPVHAWATFRVYRIEEKLYGIRDIDFLERMFQKLLVNFTWWVNRKDSSGMNVFEGGFLGLDNIGPFNRSEPLPGGGTLRQSDGTAWMAFYALTMLTMALE